MLPKAHFTLQDVWLSVSDHIIVVIWVIKTVSVAGFTKGRGTRDQIANICWIIEKTRELPKKKKSISASLTMLKSLTVWITADCVDHSILWKILKEMGIKEHLTCPLRNLYAGHEANN